MAPKKKEATPAKAEEPPAKKAKTEEPAKAEATEAKEEKKEETDAPKDTREKFGKPITFAPNQTTLNVVPTMEGQVLMAASDGGAQFLIAGAKASAGIKAGRYMFEVQMIEAFAAQNKQKGQGLLVKIGLSTAESSLFLGDEGTVCFDSDGGYTSEKKRQNSAHRFGKESIIGLVVNLDKKSPNFNTVSLFKNGARAGEPKPLPEGMQGKPLFPSVNYRAVSLHVHFGPEPLATMPFTCTTLAGAAKADIAEAPSANGKCEVVFPVGKPDEGTFEFLDGWMEQNPGYIELSERKMQEWAEKSGMWKGKGYKNSNDKPSWTFGVPAMDDRSVMRVMHALAPLVPRNYIVMEVKQNLVKADRELNLKRFPDAQFTKTALVAVGEPDKEYKGKILKKVLENKQQRMTLEWNRKKNEKRQKKMAEKKKKEMEKMKAKVQAVKAKMEAEKKKAAEEKKKKEEEEKKAKEEEKKAKEEKKEEPKEGEAKKEEAKEEKKEEAKEEKKEEAKEEKKEEEKKDMEVDTEEKKEEEEKEEAESEPEDWEKEAPVAELTEEEQKVTFKTPAVPDLTPQVLNSAFAHFSIPEKSEGFKKIVFKWSDEKKAKEYLKSYVVKTKLTARVEDLVPGEWFKTKFADFEKSKKEYETKLAEYIKKKGNKKDDEDKKDPDLASVEDVNDVGKGEPLYSAFVYEDWALMTLRYELYLMVAGFKKDVNDDERVIHESHIQYYYTKYFKKQINPKVYAKETLEGVIELVKDIMKIDPESKALVTTITDEPDTAVVFLKQAEKHRRERQRRVDAGDDTAKLKFIQPAPPKPKEIKKPEPAAAPKAAVAAPKAAVAAPKAAVAAPKAAVAAPKAAIAPATPAKAPMTPAAGKPVMPPTQNKPAWANQDKGGKPQWGNQGGNQQWGNQGGGSWGKGAAKGGAAGAAGAAGAGKGWGKAAKGGGGKWGK